jgi:rfaE bifunctional protein nucleotidyltransferase chain/domain
MLKPSQKELNIINNNISIKTESHEIIDYKNKICVKPWGYEFLVYQNDKIAIWFLNIKKDHSTSLHCHFNKDSRIIVISGSAKINLIDNEVINLNILETIMIPKYKFHGLSSFSNETFLLEIEIFNNPLNFSDKNDLLRIDDMYNRKNVGYESSINISTELDTYNYFYITNNFNKLINNVEFSTSSTINKLAKYNILLDGKVYINDMYVCPGSIINNINNMNDIINIDEPLILSINKIDYKEDAKIIYSIEQLNILKQTLKNKKIVLTSGCFDIIHIGHLNTLKHAKQLGDCLIVCLSNDEQIKLLKGNKRPINNYNDRIQLFKTITYVDYIVLYDEVDSINEITLGNIMKLLDPEYWVKGNDYNIDNIRKKHPYLRNIKLFTNIPEKSTTNIIQKILN